MTIPITCITLIGLGEVGRILAQELRLKDIQVKAYDIKYHDPLLRPLLIQHADECGAKLAPSLVEAISNAELVFSAVTAANSLDVAREVASVIHAEQYFLDLNSVSPKTKIEAQRAIKASGAHYVEVAVMAPVPPKRLATPLLLGGSLATEISQSLNKLGFNSQLYGIEVGGASAIKMCRSVMIKGLEALTTECLSAARQYGVEQQVLDSLHASFPSLGWNDRFPHYLISRVAEHGQRRAEEMREVVKTLEDVNVTPHQSLATVQTQQELVDAMKAQGLSYAELTPFVWQQTIDKLYQN